MDYRRNIDRSSSSNRALASNLLATVSSHH